MTKKYKANEKGLVSIISIMLIILIITVITLSLATLTRRNLRQSVDEQLSTQALYAAETGINDAITKIKDSTLTGNISDCNSTGPGQLFSSNILDSNSNVRYTCVLVDQTPDNINTDLTTGSLKNFKLDDSSGPISSLTFTWKSTDPNVTPVFSCPAGDGCLLSSSSWGDRLGLFRARLIPIPAGTLTRSTMANVIDIIGYPGPNSTGVTSSTMTAADKSKMLFASCSAATKACTITVSGLATPGDYFVQMYSYYKDINVTITGQTGSPGVTTRFTGAQAVIDATGASGDVLRRVKVNVSTGANSGLNQSLNNMPVYGLSVGDSLCKRFTTNSSGTSEDTNGYAPGFTCNPF